MQKFLFTIASLAIALIAYNIFKGPVEKNADIQKFINWSKNIDSYSLTSDFNNKEGNYAGTTQLKFSGNDWEMVIKEGNLKRSHWIKKGAKVYVLDFSDGKWWRVEEGSVLKPKGDFRELIEGFETREEINFVVKGKKKCKENLCLKYLIDDPEYKNFRENIGRTIWINKETGALWRQEISGDTGKSMENYSSFNETEIKIPNHTKEAKGEESFLLINSIVATASAELENLFPYFNN